MMLAHSELPCEGPHPAALPNLLKHDSLPHVPLPSPLMWGPGSHDMVPPPVWSQLYPLLAITIATVGFGVWFGPLWLYKSPDVK